MTSSRKYRRPVAAPPVRFARRRPLACRLAVIAALAAAYPAFAAPPLPAGTLPVPSAAWVTSGAATQSVAGSTLTITQTSQRAILNWQSFNIAGDAAVRFNQPNAQAAALNRIFDLNPSIIQGRLSANGQVYLINQNGILFDRGAQVNTGGLIASALNITDATFNNGLLSLAPGTAAFAQPDAGGFANSLVRVESGAEIRTEAGGRVMLLAPRVENAGLISTPEGQTVLAAGGKVYLTAPLDPALRGFLVEVDPSTASGDPAFNQGGVVVNEAVGRIVAERGNITLAGLAVRQNGQLSATTSVRLNGSIVLQARDTVREGGSFYFNTVDGIQVPKGRRTGELTVGANSVTEVRPETGDRQTVLDETTLQPSVIDMVGRTINIGEAAQVVAPSGRITISAERTTAPGGIPTTDPARLYVDRNAVIDASGLRDVAVAAEANIIEAELRGNELADSPLQRNSFLRGSTIRVDVRKGTPLADVSGFEAQVPRTIAERSTTGGTITLKSEGDTILREGSVVDVSGGSVRYLDGYVSTSKLFDAAGKIYDISTASADRVYVGFADTYTVKDAKWGVTQTFTANDRGEFSPGYTEGRGAGSLNVSGNSVVLGGALQGNVVAGARQREVGAAPAGGKLTLSGPNIRITSAPDALDSAFTFASGDLPEPFRSTTELNSGVFGNGGFSRATITSGGLLDLPAGNDLALAPGGALTLSAREIHVGSSIRTPGGSISMTTSDVSGGALPAEAHRIVVDPGVTLSTRGTWTNDNPQLTGAGSGTVAVNGGSISLNSVSDLILGAGSVLDVSGGAWLQANGKLKAGNAGSLSLQTGRFQLLTALDRQDSRLELGATLLGYAPGAGGKLSINTSYLTLGGPAAGEPGELVLGTSFFRSGGFKDYILSGTDGVNVAAGAQLVPQVQSLILRPEAAAQATGADLFAFSDLAPLPAAQRAATSVTLNADSKVHGDIGIGAGAAIRVEPTGQIALTAGRQLTVDGTLEAPAGRISLATVAPGGDDGYDPTQSIWLGAGSRLLATGHTRVTPNNRGLALGEVLAGGEITVDAAKGYLVTEAGSVMDVSGASAVLDVTAIVGGTPTIVNRSVHGHAGAINLSAREGFLLDGTLKGAAGGNAFGGALSLGLRSTGSGAIGFPGNDRVVTLAQGGSFVPGGLQAGDSLDGFAGQGRVALDQIAAGGFDHVQVRAEDRIAFAGDVAFTTRQSLGLSAPVLSATAGANVALASAHVTLGHGEPGLGGVATGGTATLGVSASLLDLEGGLALQGFGSTRLASSGDVRGKGVLQGVNGDRLAGELLTGGNLTIAADQVYPTTQSEFRIAIVGNPTGVLRIEGGDPAAAPPLSAAGQLTLEAPVIEQFGVVRAPFGSLALTAGSTLTLGETSVTSVAGSGLVPYGKTELSGRDYVYDLGLTNLILTAPPEKRIDLAGVNVDVRAGAVLDVKGGGDLYAYEFIAGPGGTKDVLDPANAAGAYAILPTANAPFAAYDHQYWTGTGGQRVGDQVYLSGGNGLAAGTYTLLPARYAALPGAYLVKPVAGSTDFLAGQIVRQADGSTVMSGYRTATGAGGESLRDARTSAFTVTPGSALRAKSEYLDTLGSRFFADTVAGHRPGDAGHVAIAATGSLALNGSLAAAAAGGRGAEVDITAPRIAVVDAAHAGAFPGFVELGAEQLSAFGAGSLLLGGTRTTGADGRTRIAVGASEVQVANGAAAPLAATEIVLAATDVVTVADGAVVTATGDVATGGRTLVIGDAGAGISGDGALVRASGGDQVALVRENVSRSTGVLDIAAGARVEAGKSLILDATNDNRVAGSIALGDGGALSLGARRISVGETAGVVDGLVFSNDRLAALGNPAELLLRSYSTVDLYGAAVVGGASLRTLAIDSAGVFGYQAGAGTTATLTAGTVTFSNLLGTAPSAAPPLLGGALPVSGTGTLAVNAERIVSGAAAPGARFNLGGFTQTNLGASQTVVVEGSGGLQVAGALTIAAPQITAAAGARQTLTATGTLSTALLPGDPAPAGVTDALGAQLTLEGARVQHAGRIDLPSGKLTLAATGTNAGDNVVLAAGSQINAGGVSVPFADTSRQAPGGDVTLSAVRGNIRIEGGAVVDVTGAPGGDAGSLTLSAVQGTAVLDGMLKGYAGGAAAQAGRFMLDAGSLASFSAVNAPLNVVLGADGKPLSGGFDAERSVRVRVGNLDVAAGDTVQAEKITLAADAGRIDVRGTLDANGARGGSVTVAARDDVVLHAGAGVRATGADTGARGGDATFMSRSGQLDLRSGSTVDLSAGTGGTGGALLLRAARNGGGTDVQIAPVAAAITGAATVTVEGVRAYDNISTLGTTAGAGRLTYAQMNTDNTGFMANAPAIATRLGLADAPGTDTRVRPGVEVRNAAGDITVANDLHLGTFRYGGEPGTLTVRASGNVNVNGSVSDGFNSALTTATLQPGQSWSYRLVAGADTSAADPLATRAGAAGDVVLAASKLIRTGTGDIDIAAARDIRLTNDASVIYTAGVPGPTLADFPNITFATVTAEFPTGGGDLSLAAGGNITAGAPATQLVTDWLYRQGARGTEGEISTRTAWWPRFRDFRQGVGALGGGDVTVSAGGDVNGLGISLPTNGRLAGALNTVPDPARLVVQGGGDLTLRVGGDLNTATVYADGGSARIEVGGDIGSNRDLSTRPLYSFVALGDTQATVRAYGDITLETVFNPTLISQANGNITGVGGSQRRSFFSTYGDAALDITSVAGNVGFVQNINGIGEAFPRFNTGTAINEQGAFFIHPGTFGAAALRGDVTTGGRFTLLPGAGNLELLAGNNLTVNSTISVPDVPTSRVPVPVRADAAFSTGVDRYILNASAQGAEFHADPSAHTGATEPLRFVARTGDVSGPVSDVGQVSVFGIFPKAATVEAGRDIRNVWLIGQNLDANDVTRFAAGRDFLFTTLRDSAGNQLVNTGRVEIGGPGRLEVVAGRNVDLGNSQGLVTRGNFNNPFLPEDGAAITVIAGASRAPDYQRFFNTYLYAPAADAPSYTAELTAYVRQVTGDATLDDAQALARFQTLAASDQRPFAHQVLFAELKAAGRNAVANAGGIERYARGYAAIAALFPAEVDGKPVAYAGDLNLFFSQIKTEQGGDINLLVPGGLVNAGLASAGSLNKAASELGIVTARGGTVNGFVRDDFLVNQSRVFTLGGGDILLWSSEGDIDAGKGAKTASATPPPRIVIRGDQVILDTSQSIAGSGIGVLLGRDGITPGNVDLIAPKGEVNAGDAGIRSAGNLSISAVRVVGADNISVGGASTGVPAPAGGTASGLAGGASTTANATRSAEQAVQNLGGAQADAFRPTFVNWEVLGLGEP